jgi:hypothetical protein
MAHISRRSLVKNSSITRTNRVLVCTQQHNAAVLVVLYLLLYVLLLAHAGSILRLRSD